MDEKVLELPPEVGDLPVINLNRSGTYSYVENMRYSQLQDVKHPARFAGSLQATVTSDDEDLMFFGAGNGKCMPVAFLCNMCLYYVVAFLCLSNCDPLQMLLFIYRVLVASP